MKPKYSVLRWLSVSIAAAAIQPATLCAAPFDILKAWNFNTDGDFEGWAEGGGADKLKGPNYDGTVDFSEEEVAGGSLRAKVIASDPQLEVSGLTLSAAQVGYIKMRYRVLDGAGTPIIPPPTDLLLSTPGGVQGNANATSNSQTVVDAVNGWTENVWNLTDVFTGTLTALRIDPVGGPIDGGNGIFEIDYIQALETDVAPPFVVEVDPPAIAPRYQLVREWTTDADWAKWTPTDFTIDSITGGVLSGTSTSGDAQLSVTNAADFGAPVPAPVSGKFVFEYAITQGLASSGEQILFYTDDAGGVSAARSVTTADTDNAPHVVRATLTNLITGNLTGLRFDPSAVIDAPTSLDYFRVYVDTTIIGWDTNLSVAGAQGGTGAWNHTDPFFYDGDTNKTWPNTSSGDNDATFAGIAGTVTVDAGGITANDLRFFTSGYTLTGGPLTLDGAIATLTSPAGSTTTIDAPLIRSGGSTDLLKIAGPGIFDFGGGGNLGRKLHFITNASLTGGTFASDGATSGSNGLVVFNSATLTLDGGTLTRVNGDADDALYVGSPASSGDFAGASRPGTFNVVSGNLDVSGGRGVAVAFGGSSNSTMNVSGGTITSTQIAVGWNSNGNVNVSGGDVSVNTASATSDAIRHTDAGNGIFTMTGGIARSGNVKLSTNGSGTDSLTVNLNGGILETERIWLSRGASVSGTHTTTVNLDGGTLRLPTVAPTGSTGHLLGDITNPTNGTLVFQSFVRGNGAVIDTNGRDTEIISPLQEDAASPGGGLTKNGAGLLNLSAENTYTGPTTVTAGTLQVNGLSLSDAGRLSISGGKVLLPAGVTETVNTLFLNGVAQPAGDYGSSASAAPPANRKDGSFDIGGTGILTVLSQGSAASYANFAAGFTSPPLSNTAATADPDFDGLPNALEYVIGGDPRVSSQAGRPTSMIVGNDLVFSFTRVDSSESPDVTLVVETSTNLADWATQPSFTIGATTGNSTPGVTVAENGSAPDTITVTISGGARKFARLSVRVSP